MRLLTSTLKPFIAMFHPKIRRFTTAIVLWWTSRKKIMRWLFSMPTTLLRLMICTSKPITGVVPLILPLTSLIWLWKTSEMSVRCSPIIRMQDWSTTRWSRSRDWDSLQMPLVTVRIRSRSMLRRSWSSHLIRAPGLRRALMKSHQSGFASSCSGRRTRKFSTRSMRLWSS